VAGKEGRDLVQTGIAGMDRIIVSRRSELRGAPHPLPFQPKKWNPPSHSKIILQRRKSTKIGKKITKSRKIVKSSLKNFKMTLIGCFGQFLSI
jgi:hypothetical protein